MKGDAGRKIRGRVFRFKHLCKSTAARAWMNWMAGRAERRGDTHKCRCAGWPEEERLRAVMDSSIHIILQYRVRRAAEIQCRLSMPSALFELHSLVAVSRAYTIYPDSFLRCYCCWFGPLFNSMLFFYWHRVDKVQHFTLIDYQLKVGGIWWKKKSRIEIIWRVDKDRP